MRFFTSTIARPTLLGVISVLGALILELLATLLLDDNQKINSLPYPSYNTLGLFSLIAFSFIEELLKFFFIFQNFIPKKRFFIFEALIFGLGFSSLEIFFRLMDKNINLGEKDMALSIAAVVALHILTAVFIVLSLTNNHISFWRKINTIIFATALHVFFNWIIQADLGLSAVYSFLSFLILILAGKFFLGVRRSSSNLANL